MRQVLTLRIVKTMQKVLASIILANFDKFKKKFLHFANIKNLSVCVLDPIWVKFVIIILGIKKNVFEMTLIIISPTQLTYQSGPLANLFNNVFHPIWI